MKVKTFDNKDNFIADFDNFIKENPNIIIKFITHAEYSATFIGIEFFICIFYEQEN